jgi:general nucleoside transport system permease protein
MTTTTTEPPEAPPPEPPSPMESAAGVGDSLARSLLVPALAVVAALVIGALIIALTDVTLVPQLFSDPGPTLAAMGREVLSAYRALFRGAVGSVYAISETLFATTPLLLASLGVALGFRAGLFNIGAQGQMLMGGMLAALLGIYLDLPGPIHIIVCILGGIVGGVVWGGIAGLLKARTGAHEVITTIMFNFVAIYLAQWLLTIPLFQEAGRNNPVSEPLQPSAVLSPLFGSTYRVTIGFLIAVAMVFVVHWLLFRSSFGFEFRAIGLNPEAGAYAGMGVVSSVVLAMGLAGGLAGMAGATQLMSLAPFKATVALPGSVGFDAITVALLGRSHPVGVLWASLLFGALKAGGREMQGAAQIPLDLVTVLQALIVIFIAAPALVKAIFRLRGEAERPAQLSKGWGS